MRLALLLLGLALAAPATAGEPAQLGPDIPMATGEPHPEGNDTMRRRHMEMMKHDRDLTMRDGTRDIGASLSGCFECHSVADGTGGYVTYESEKHFCRACHDFAAVKVDCFMCHRSTPDGVDEGAAHAAILPQTRLRDDDGTSIIAYLRQVGQGDAQPGSQGND